MWDTKRSKLLKVLEQSARARDRGQPVAERIQVPHSTPPTRKNGRHVPVKSIDQVTPLTGRGKSQAAGSLASLSPLTATVIRIIEHCTWPVVSADCHNGHLFHPIDGISSRRFLSFKSNIVQGHPGIDRIMGKSNRTFDILWDWIHIHSCSIYSSPGATHLWRPLTLSARLRREVM